MATEVSENSKFTLSLKSIIAIVMIASSFIGMYYSLSMDIQKAMELPKSDISRNEIDLKLNLISNTVMSNADKLEKIEGKMEKIEERVYELK
jgi:hypothetical protein|tara:strand:+ start:201 stop:476 length:276 start_codon:yes stop_codon:yes gene_type:complete